jgi:hypothetical protein
LKNHAIGGAQAIKSSDAEPLRATLIQKRFDTWAWVISSCCTVGVDSPASFKTDKKPITLVTRATKPKSFGTSSRFNTITEIAFRPTLPP